jgi:hypothetical protein
LARCQKHQRQHELNRPRKPEGVQEAVLVCFSPAGDHNGERPDHQPQDDGVEKGNGEVSGVVLQPAFSLAEKWSPRFPAPEQRQKNDRQRSPGENGVFHRHPGRVEKTNRHGKLPTLRAVRWATNLQRRFIRLRRGWWHRRGRHDSAPSEQQAHRQCRHRCEQMTFADDSAADYAHGDEDE